MTNYSKLAQELGISKSYLSMILSGQREVPAKLRGHLFGLVRKSASGRTSQAESREFESRLPLHPFSNPAIS